NHSTAAPASSPNTDAADRLVVAEHPSLTRKPFVGSSPSPAHPAPAFSRGKPSSALHPHHNNDLLHRFPPPSRPPPTPQAFSPEQGLLLHEHPSLSTKLGSPPVSLTRAAGLPVRPPSREAPPPLHPPPGAAPPPCSPRALGR
uniref:Uncharacterized protein n=1 Tax=Triticum urartu TaxID=4572 RepID=A0A8R7QQ58_TRIUA